MLLNSHTLHSNQSRKVNMPLKVIVLALPLLAMQSTCLAQGVEKKGLPCVGELCLGDGIAELSKIQWAPAQGAFKIDSKAQLSAARKLSEDDLRTVKAAFPNAGEAAPYLYDKQFDAAALPFLTRLAAACESNELFGTYGANTETPTRVGISLTPSLTEAGKQAWTVTTIVREFPSALSNVQKGDITTQLNQRYAKYGAGNPNIQPAKPGEARFFPSGMTRFGFGLSLARGTDEAARLKQHPVCASDKAKAG
jgi:hypothetical protein